MSQFVNPKPWDGHNFDSPFHNKSGELDVFLGIINIFIIMNIVLFCHQ